MSTSAVLFTASLEGLTAAAVRAGADAAGARALADDDLLAAQRALAVVKQHVDACAAVLAGETVRRSAVDAGLGGLARRQGFRTPEALVRGVTGSTAREATTLVRVGSMLNDAELIAAAHSGEADGASSDPAAVFRLAKEPWLAAVGTAVAAGMLTIAAAEAIRSGLGTPGPGVSVEALSIAAEVLVASVLGYGDAARAYAESGADTAAALTAIDAERVLRMARDARDELDSAGIIERERQQRSMRSFRRWRGADGMTSYTWKLHPEDAAFVDDVYDKITSPRRGGPRFIASADQERADRARAESIASDDRTVEQFASDSFLELLQLGVDTDPTTILGVHRPAVRVLVAAKDLQARRGRGWIEGQDLPVSIATVERQVCRGGIDELVFDERRQPINLGRTQRVFTRAQRRLLSARDGGCRWPGCERPPEWSEAHHIRWWDRDNGPTDIDNGILLCRHHHLLLHDNGWEIEIAARGGPDGREAASEHEYWLVPPPDVDPGRSRRPMPSKSRALDDAFRPRELVPA